ncbi:GntR family transcriptional regulator [Aestuariivirga sp.]|uniref:GntR family transcriptional regulator n=1 Tax=Aestuariivirga sp. TaxID=2650926 RepID=UPI0039E2D8E5
MPPELPLPSTVIPRPKGLADEAYDVIFAKLMALEIAPGARVTVDALVKELGVSHTPIREALGRLEGEGLVVKAHLAGYRAAPQISRRRFDELYDLRLLLEPFAADHAASRMNAHALHELEDLAQRMQKPGRRKERLDYSAFARLDAEFHDRILALSGNELIRDTLGRLHVHFHLFRLMFHARVTEEALNEHEALLAAFRTGDAGGAGHAMHDHIAKSRQRLVLAFS